MRQYLNENDKIISVRLELRHPNGKSKIWVLVEGEDDVKIFRKLIDAPNVSIEQVPGGVENLRKAVSILTQETDRVIGIRDADFLHLDKKEEEFDSLFVTDKHDMEMMLINSDKAFCSAYSEFCNVDLATCFELREKILISIRFLGGIRYFNHKNDYRLNFKKLGFGNFYDGSKICIEKDECIRNINERSPNKVRLINCTDAECIIKGIDDLYNLCCGHDAVKALASYFSTCQVSGISEKNVASGLRTAYSIEEFETTKLYKELSKWQIKSGYKLFAASRYVDARAKKVLPMTEAANPCAG